MQTILMILAGGTIIFAVVGFAIAAPAILRRIEDRRERRSPRSIDEIRKAKRQLRSDMKRDWDQDFRDLSG